MSYEVGQHIDLTWINKKQEPEPKKASFSHELFAPGTRFEFLSWAPFTFRVILPTA